MLPVEKESLDISSVDSSAQASSAQASSAQASSVQASSAQASSAQAGLAQAEAPGQRAVHTSSGQTEAQAARALLALQAVDEFRPARTYAQRSVRKAGLAQKKPEQEKPTQEKPVSPESKGKARSFCKQGGQCQSPAGLSTLAALCSGPTTSSVSAGTVSLT
jgi:hypothetical protein